MKSFQLVYINNGVVIASCMADNIEDANDYFLTIFDDGLTIQQMNELHVIETK